MRVSERMARDILTGAGRGRVRLGGGGVGGGGGQDLVGGGDAIGDGGRGRFGRALLPVADLGVHSLRSVGGDARAFV